MQQDHRHALESIPGWTEFVGNSDCIFKSFCDARIFVQGLGLKGQSDWRDYCKSGSKPTDIPADPSRAYRDDGWVGFNDWLGTTKTKGCFRSFEDARSFVHGLGFKCRRISFGLLPNLQYSFHSPTGPNQTYKSRGWVSWGDWLGTGTVHVKNRIFLQFHDARKVVQSLGLSGETQWRQYVKSGRLQLDIPTNPATYYQEWISWGDWLGTGTIATSKKNFCSIKEAMAIAKKYKITNMNEWNEFRKSDNNSEKLPASPWHTYKNQGWTSFGAFFGNSRKHS